MKDIRLSVDKKSCLSVKSLEVLSPAKLNLFLDVLGSRSDGYHELLTLFERISLCDRIGLRVLPSPDIRIATSSPDIPLDRRNLAYRAALLLQTEYRVDTGVFINIEKNIPVGGGLGGGSSNAASVLLGLNHLWRLGLTRDELVDCANRLGSDVAFFITQDRFALGRGRGGDLERVSVNSRVKLWHLLYFGAAKVLTKDVYRALDREENSQKIASRGQKCLKLTKKRPDVNILISHLRKRDVLTMNRTVYNRLTETVVKSYTFVSRLRADLLSSGLKDVHMSGSGPTLFSIFRTRQEALKKKSLVESKLKHRCRVILASTW